jgi:hypothetical protein
VGLDGFKVLHAFCNDSGSVPGTTELLSRPWSHS